MLIWEKSASGGGPHSAALSRRRRSRIRVWQRSGQRVICGVVGHVIDLGVNIVVVVAGSKIGTERSYAVCDRGQKCKLSQLSSRPHNASNTDAQGPA